MNYELFFNAIPDAAVAQDEKGRIVLVNDAALALLGYERSELVGQTIEMLVPARYREKHMGHRQEYAHNPKVRMMGWRSGMGMELLALSKNGLEIPVDINLSHFSVSDRRYTIVTLREVADRMRFEELLKWLASDTPVGTAEAFLGEVARRLSQTLNAEFVFIGRRIAGTPEKLRTLAWWHEGQLGENMEYELAGSPCEHMSENKFCFYPSGVRQMYPNHEMLESLGVEGFVAVPIFDSQGRPAGNMGVMSRSPFHEGAFIQMVLNLFAMRVSGEIERLSVETVLRESEERNRLLISHMPGMVYKYRLTDLEKQEFIYVSPGSMELFGFSPEEVMNNFDRIWSLVPPEDVDELWKTILKSARDLALWEHEFRVVLPSGRVKWLHGRSQPEISQNAGCVVWNGILLDVTERKQYELDLQKALSKNELLLREVHHRVRNNLQIMSSLINLQVRSSRNAEVGSALSDYRNRIEAMSLVHSHLYNEEDKSVVNMRLFVRSLALRLNEALLRADDKIKIEEKVGDVMLPVNLATYCGILLTELVTNSVKHAFAGRDNGKILISMVENEGTVMLKVVDDGVGIAPSVLQKENTGIGINLIKLLGEKQLQGKLDVTNSPGADYCLTFCKK